MAEIKAKLVLPSVKSEVDKRWVSQDFLVIGPPKIGKSEFFSFGERTLYIETEPGLKHLSVMKVPCLCWADFVAVYEQLLALTKSGKEFPYDTLVIDTVDRWVDYLNDEVVARGQSKFKSAEINSIGDIPNGQGYSWASEKLGNALAKLSELPCAIVLIGHLASKEISFENNVKMTMQTIALTPSIGKNICSWADHILNIEGGNKTGDRKVRTRPSGSVMAGSRGGVVPEDFTWTKDNKANYEQFRKLFT
jgi:hypothetical protein